jgi:UDP-glucose 4-epimerase
MTALAGRVALVTGASGFIGSAVARRLRQAGAVVHAVSRRRQAEGDSTHWWTVDLADLPQVRRVVATVKPEIVFHLAGVASGARDLEEVLPILHANLVAAVNLLVATTEASEARVVFGGSLEEEMANGAWPVPSSPYAAAKLAAGAYARMCHALYGTRAVWLRLAMVYGPAQPDLRKLIPYATVSFLRGEAPALSSGSRPVDWVYIDDVVDALLATAVAVGVDGRTLDVASGRLVTVREVVEQIRLLVAAPVAPRFGALPERPLERVRVADVASTAASLGWRARTSLENGLRRTVEWYRRQGLAPGQGLLGA